MTGIIGIDLSLRSSGLVCIDHRKNIVDLKVIKSKPNDLKSNKKLPYPVKNDEELLIYNSLEMESFIYENYGYGLKGIVIEGLAYGGQSGMKDIIQGNFWYCRTFIYDMFKPICIGIVPVTEWRKPIVPEVKQAKKDLKEKYGKEWVKIVTYNRLPKKAKCVIDKYILDNKLPKKTEYDLADAYFLSVFRLGLE
ncbi:MAG: hypothetical protein GQ540_03885 [Lutibacter sp.]|uniref:hypothetical protein n=1 Tax=Lutibacter sp. TaxID=1925666 RepID=UPI0019F2F98F|nr:hypothetical protein [Lutibacter sp.]NOR27654.1 hypothetical protein [Lutibacter sp.]